MKAKKADGQPAPMALNFHSKEFGILYLEYGK